MGGIITLVFILAVCSGVAFIFNIIDFIQKKGRASVKATVISFILTAISVPILVILFNKMVDSQNGTEVARYNQTEYDLDRIFMEYYTRQSLHEGGYYYSFEIEFDAIEEESIEIRKGTGEYNDKIIIVYHKYPQENSFLDPFNLEDYRR